MRRLLMLACLLLAAPVSAQSILIHVGKTGPVQDAGGSPISITTDSPLPTGTEGTAYTVTITATGGSGTGYTLTKPTGTFPAGLTITSASNPMVISGTPTVGSSAGTASFTLLVTDSMAATSGNVPFQVAIGYGSPSFTTSASLGACTQDASCNGVNTLVCTGGLAPRTYAVVSGTFPPNLTLNSSTGAITGTESAAGTYVFTARCTDAVAGFGERTFTLPVAAAVTGDCAGVATDDYFTCMKNFQSVVSGGQPMATVGWNFRSNAEITSQGGKPTTYASAWKYDYAGDTYASKQDAARADIQIGYHSIDLGGQIKSNLDYTSGVTVMTWDTWSGNDDAIGALSCAGTGVNLTQKAYQLAGGQAAIYREAQEQFSTGKGYDGNTVPGWNPVKPITLTAITAVGTLATATHSGAITVTNGQTVDVVGPTNAYVINLTSISSGSPSTVTTATPHGLTGTFYAQLAGVAGESPNLQAEVGWGQGTVTGLSTFTFTRAMTVGGTGGTATIYPYSQLQTTATVLDSTHFTYPIAGLGTASATATGAVKYAIGNTETQTNGGTDCSTAGMRSYSYPDALASSDAPGQLASFIIKCKTWTRWWFVVRHNAGTDWICDTVPGKHDLISLYIADVNQAPVRLFADFISELDALNYTRISDGRVFASGIQQCDTATGAITNPNASNIVYFRTLLSLWMEQNSSSGTCYGGTPITRRKHMRNLAVVNTPVASGVITLGSTSININGTEVLVKPVP